MDILETTRTLWHCVDYSKSKINQTCALSSCLKSLRVSAVQPFMLKKKTQFRNPKVPFMASMSIMSVRKMSSCSDYNIFMNLCLIISHFKQNNIKYYCD